MARIKDITFQNVRNYVEGNIFAALEKNLPDHISEQAMYRMALCLDCLKNGRCLKCGCKTPQLFYAPMKQDDKWGPMMSKSEWEKFKTTREYLDVINGSNYDEVKRIRRR